MNEHFLNIFKCHLRAQRKARQGEGGGCEAVVLSARHIPIQPPTRQPRTTKDDIADDDFGLLLLAVTTDYNVLKWAIYLPMSRSCRWQIAIPSHAKLSLHTLYSVQCTLAAYSVKCTVYSVQCTVCTYSVQCTTLHLRIEDCRKLSLHSVCCTAVHYLDN